MKRALVIPLLWIAVLSGGPVSAVRDHALRDPSVKEVLLMVRGGVASDVMAERVRRMQDVPTLDVADLGALTNKGVPDQVLLELVLRKKAVEPCELPERRVGVREVLDHPSIREVRHQLETGAATDAIVERVGHLYRVPVLDARAIAKLTSQGVPDKVLLALVRKQEIRTGCDPVRAELLAALGDVEKSVVVVETKQERKDERERQKEALRTETEKKEEAAKETRKAELRREAAAKKAMEREEKEKLEVAKVAPSEPTDASAGESTRMGRIRVVAKSSLPVTYLEVLIDGDPVTRKGEVQEGETKPGWMLPPPPVLDVKRGAVVFESELPIGPYEIRTAFALSRIVDTDWDAVAEARGQRYDTTMAGPAGENGEVPVCEVREGRVCVVVARLLKRKDGYAVAYDARLR